MKKYILKNLFSVSNNIILSFLVASLQVYGALRMANVASELIGKNYNQFLYEIFIVLLLWVISLTISYFQNIYQEKTIQNISNDIRVDMLNISWQLRKNNISKQMEKDILSFLQNDIKMIEDNVIRNYFTMFKFIGRGIFSLVALLIINVWLFIIAIVLSLILYYVPSKLRNFVKYGGTKVSESNNKYLARISDLIVGIDTLKEFKAHKFYNVKSSRELENLKVSKVIFAKRNSLMTSIIFIMNVVSQLIVVTVTGVLIFKEIIEVGYILSTTELAMKTFDAMSLVNQYLSIINSSSHLVNKVDEYKIPEYSKENVSTADFQKLQVENLSFSYGEKKMISSFNQTFEKGKFYVISGESGVGKSTFFKILLQQIDNYSGKILLDNVDLKNKDVSNIFSYLKQYEHLFSSSIEDNILLGREKNDNFYNIVDKLNINLQADTSTLSGGEKQRVFLARVLMKPNPILLLDESFSNLDVENTNSILKNLVKENVTIIILITHRLKEIENLNYTLINF